MASSTLKKRKNKAVEQRFLSLSKVDNCIQCIWMQSEGYFTYMLFFESEAAAKNAISEITVKFPDTWIEFVGLQEMECQDDIKGDFDIKGYCLEVVFLE
jgi:hypothetical protein